MNKAEVVRRTSSEQALLERDALRVLDSLQGTRTRPIGRTTVRNHWSRTKTFGTEYEQEVALTALHIFDTQVELGLRGDGNVIELQGPGLI